MEIIGIIFVSLFYIIFLIAITICLIKDSKIPNRKALTEEELTQKMKDLEIDIKFKLDRWRNK